MSIQNGQFLYPSVTSLPGQAGVQPAGPGKAEGAPGEFGQILDRNIESERAGSPGGTSARGPATPGLTKASELSSLGGVDLGQLRQPLKFSAHATQRLNERKIQLDQAMMGKVNDAVDKAAAKGVEDTLVLTPDAALIVSVKNRTVITAMDRGSLTGNVFTNIDGAVIV
jgi:flagellar operon protein